MNEPVPGYQFTNEWFAQNTLIWDKVVPRHKPQRILEVGSYEGRSACYFIERFGQERRSISCC